MSKDQFEGSLSGIEQSLSEGVPVTADKRELIEREEALAKLAQMQREAETRLRTTKGLGHDLDPDRGNMSIAEAIKAKEEKITKIKDILREAGAVGRGDLYLKEIDMVSLEEDLKLLRELQG